MTGINPYLCCLSFSSAFVPRLYHLPSRITIFGHTVLIFPRPFPATRFADLRCIPTPTVRVHPGRETLIISTVTPGAFPSTFPISAIVDVPPISRFVTSYARTELSHLSSSSATLVNADTPNLHTHAQLDPYLAATRSSGLRDFCNAVVWDDRRRADFRIHVKPKFQTDARVAFTSCTPTRKRPRPSGLLYQCLSQGRHLASVGNASTPPGLLHRGIAVFLGIGRG